MRAPRLRGANTFEAITAHSLASRLTSAQRPLLSLRFPGSFQKPLLRPFRAAGLQHTPRAGCHVSFSGRWGGGPGSGVLTFLARACTHCPLIASVDTWGQQVVASDNHLHLAGQVSNPENTGEQVQTTCPTPPPPGSIARRAAGVTPSGPELRCGHDEHRVAWLGGWSPDGGRLLCPQRVTAVRGRRRSCWTRRAGD